MQLTKGYVIINMVTINNTYASVIIIITTTTI
jgi:hypothetical protein